MPTRTARSTPSQRLRLTQLELDLREAFQALPGRFWTTRSLEQSYRQVLAHLQSWSRWEESE